MAGIKVGDVQRRERNKTYRDDEGDSPTREVYSWSIRPIRGVHHLLLYQSTVGSEAVERRKTGERGGAGRQAAVQISSAATKIKSKKRSGKHTTGRCMDIVCPFVLVVCDRTLECLLNLVENYLDLLIGMRGGIL